MLYLYDMDRYVPILILCVVCILAILRRHVIDSNKAEDQRAEKEIRKIVTDAKQIYQVKVDQYKQMDRYLQECNVAEEYNFTEVATRKRLTAREWFITDWGKKSIPSPAEQLIINELVKYPIKWYREVSFKNLQLVSTGYARFDFYFPDHNLCIEYQGKIWHVAPDRVENDKIKARYCIKNHIELMVLDSSSYYHMQHVIYKLMKRLQVV